MTIIASLGSAVLDLQYRGEANLLRRARMRPRDTLLVDAREQESRRQVLESMAGQPEVASGGSAANSLVLASTLGIECRLMSQLGQDPEGEKYRNDLQAAGVQLLTPEHVTGPTATCLVVTTPDGERSMSSHMGCCSELSPDILNSATIGEAEWLLLEGYMLAATGGREIFLRAQKTAQQANTRIALSLSSALLVREFQGTIDELLEGQIDLLIGNEAEATALSTTSGAEDAMEILKGRAESVAITMAERGCLFSEADEQWHQPAEEVKVQSVLGAGDAFAGGLLTALVMGMDAREATLWGCLSGTAQVQCPGPRLEAGYLEKLIDSLS